MQTNQGNKELKGLGGWLILVGIGVLVAPFKTGAVLINTFLPIFSHGMWAILTDPTSNAYHPLWGPYILSEVITNIGLLAASSYMILLFFKKSKSFPKWFMTISVLSLLIIIVDTFAVKLILPGKPVVNLAFIENTTTAFVTCLIWVPYMLVSKRVKSTFVQEFDFRYLHAPASKLQKFSIGLIIVSLFVMIYLWAAGYGISAFSRINYEQVSSLETLFLSVILESLPFLLIGAFVSAVIEVFISEETIAGFLPKRTLPGLIAAAFMGMIFPICECGIVMVASRLIRKGVPLHIAITFMLAAPVINPVALVSTIMAFPTGSMAVYRIVGTFIVSVFAGLITYLHFGSQNILREDTCDNHSHRDCSDHPDNYHSESLSAKLNDVLLHTCNEFFTMGMYFIIGAFLASLVQVVIPRSAIASVGHGKVLSIPVMMLFGFGLSICSSADAFVARAMSSSFSTGSIVAFLVYGAMIDLKNTLMMSSQFKASFVSLLILIVTLLTFSYALISVNLLGV